MSDTGKIWVHTHLPRLRAGETNVLSVKRPGETIKYASWVSMKNVEFFVSPSRHQRCLAEGVRSFRAWVVGDEILTEEDYLGRAPRGWHRAVYDPKKGPSFVNLETLKPVHQAFMAIMVGKDLYYW